MEEKHRKSEPGESVTEPRFGPSISEIRGCNTLHLTSTFSLFCMKTWSMRVCVRACSCTYAYQQHNYYLQSFPKTPRHLSVQPLTTTLLSGRCSNTCTRYQCLHPAHAPLPVMHMCWYSYSHIDKAMMLVLAMSSPNRTLL
jgi:hypothetical protein